MHIIDIKEAGANNMLKWAISQGADIKSDNAMMNLINDEVFYLVTLGGINFFELFRLTQMYRDKLRITNSSQAEIPLRKDLHEVFPGETATDENNPEPFQYCQLAENAITSFMNLVQQMMTDKDIIGDGAARLFIPMICTKYEVQIPVAFADVVGFMNEDEVKKAFNENYPDTLKDLLEDPNHSFQRMLGIGFTKGTQIHTYEQRYDTLIKKIKYSALNKQEFNGRLYKIHLAGFAKKDPVLKSEVRVSMFKPNSDEIKATMKRMARLNTPLEAQFVIQLPIFYLQELENRFGRDVLNIFYESSMNNIIEVNQNLTFEDFKTLEFADATDEQQVEVEERVNEINAYKVRITEANDTLLKTIHIILESLTDIHVTSVFAMLPPIYYANAVIQVNQDDISKFTQNRASLISDMFEEMESMMVSVGDEIRKQK